MTQCIGGYALLANVGHLEISNPFEIIAGIVLRPAQPHEVKTFHNLIEQTISSSPIPRLNPYETRTIATRVGGSQTTYEFEPLNAGEFKYNVAEFKGSNLLLSSFIESTSLTPWDINVGITVINMGVVNGLSLDPNLERALEIISIKDDYLMSLNHDDLSEIKSIFGRFLSHENTRVDLREALRQYKQLQAIPPTSSLRFLGYVAILESLITHSPEPNDPYDSLTRQVRQKMLLLDRRFIRKLPYKRYFGSGNPGTIWTKLYSYRSAIAHGTKPNFSGEFQILHNHESALDFIRCATSYIMRQALEEPDLITDLRDC